MASPSRIWDLTTLRDSKIVQHLTTADKLLFFNRGSGRCRHCRSCQFHDFWSRILQYEWDADEWHDQLVEITGFINRTFPDLLLKLEPWERKVLPFTNHRSQMAFEHGFHDGKYTNNFPPYKTSTIGDAILRLWATVMVDAMEDNWSHHEVHIYGCYTRQTTQESVAARVAVENSHLAVLFDKMQLSIWLSPSVRDLLSQQTKAKDLAKAKGDVMEDLIFRLSTKEGEDSFLAEMLIASMVQALVWFGTYNIIKKKPRVFYLSRNV